MDDSLSFFFSSGQFPQSENGWAFTVPQTDEDVAALFCRLTLTSQYPPQTCKQMTYPDFIKQLAKTLGPSHQLDVVVLLDACEGAVKQGGYVWKRREISKPDTGQAGCGR